MSKAKNLGVGASFAQARPISARRAAIGAATTAPTAGVPDPTELPLDLISQNPDNPREELRDLEGLADSIREIGLVNSITVATVDAYLAERPERVAELDEGTRYIVVDGHRRLEAARIAGASTIRVSVNNKLVATDEALLEAAFVANIQRDDMNPIEQAHALKSLVQFYGSQNKAAKRLGIGQSTISSKLSILDLAPALQADLVEGRRTIEHVRNLSKLSPEEQRAKADARAEAAGKKGTATRDLSRRDNPGAGTSRPDGTGADLSRRDNPGARDDVPGQRDGSDPLGGAASDAGQGLQVPWHDGAALMDTAFDRLDADQRSEFILRYFRRSQGVEAVIADMRGNLPPQARSSLAAILQRVSAGLLDDA
ncbi:ParB/RepB/Spo0J family partition protein [Streptomyces sp. NPDC004520]|uniref:ParB/RepB/Spo0J family partition protein n=1 Tax=Streptomyces sp. NPDC004520 TaxID=3364702 RepID=UPI0036B0E7CB